jgi:hypothetical protein
MEQQMTAFVNQKLIETGQMEAYFVGEETKDVG